MRPNFPAAIWVLAALGGACSGQGVDCFFDPPLGCELAQSLYEDATCQTHPPCAVGD